MAEAAEAPHEKDAVQAGPPTANETAPESGSKKRAREEDHEAEEGQATKKLDTKDDAS